MKTSTHSGTFEQIAKISVLGFALLLTIGCGHSPKQVRLDPEELAPAPGAYQPSSEQGSYPQQPRYGTPQQGYSDPQSPSQQQRRARGGIPTTPLPPGGVTDADYDFIERHRPLVSEFGLATWYTAPYKGRAAANGQTFDDMALTAAHRTLPMGSLVVVTNLRTGQACAMRISDRGPFVDGRIVDMTIASARATGIYRRGVAKVRVDVYQTPKPIETGGRWCVQVGAFSSESKAIRLKRYLLNHYPGAHVIEFPGESSFWVRIRPEGDDRGTAEYIAEHLHLAEGKAFLTRLD